MARKEPIRPTRPDILPTHNQDLAQAVAAALHKQDKPQLTQQVQEERLERATTDTRYASRMGMTEGSKADPNGFERIIGVSDLMSINFLDRGKRAAAAVCRIRTPVAGGMAYGTGFMVGPRLLLTNNHVLPTPESASQSDIEFDYEHDLDGVLRHSTMFNLRPGEVFFTSQALDFTMVAVAPFADNGSPIERYGRLPLIPVTGKVVDGEWVTIIQHPNGQPKQIAIRASQVLALEQDQVPEIDLSRFMHYSTDTEPGSSGSPVLNDQWGVVALHHKAVPSPDGATDENGEPIWIGNEGVRISAIFERLEHSRFEQPHAAEALNRLSVSLGLPPHRPLEQVQTEQYAPLPAKHWTGKTLGYDPDFLRGNGAALSLDTILAPKADQLAPLVGNNGHILDYLHFSVAMHAERRFALMTAVNIDGKQVRHPGKRKDTWRLDARMAAKYQADDEFYVTKLAEEKVYFSRGHLVRLFDPCWGSAADSRTGMEHSFHFTNAAPQFQAYNDSDWGNLEDYLLDKAQMSEKRMTVFTGPIFRDDDPFYGTKRKGGPWQIPLSYWKIAVLQKSPTKVSAAAFIVGQTEYVKALYEAKIFSGLTPYTIDDMRSRHIQTTVRAVMQESGLDFTRLIPFDTQGTLESTQQTRWINRPGDVSI